MIKITDTYAVEADSTGQLQIFQWKDERISDRGKAKGNKQPAGYTPMGRYPHSMADAIRRIIEFETTDGTKVDASLEVYAQRFEDLLNNISRRTPHEYND